MTRVFPIAANSLRNCGSSFLYRLDNQASTLTGLFLIRGHSEVFASLSETLVNNEKLPIQQLLSTNK